LAGGGIPEVVDELAAMSIVVVVHKGPYEMATSIYHRLAMRRLAGAPVQVQDLEIYALPLIKDTTTRRERRPV
jgi:hypothetical protein